MKERGIIFSGPMVRAILERRKTQTRRVMKNPPTLMDKVYAKLFRKDFGGRKCPYGIPGDRLYVREAFAVYLPWYNKQSKLFFRAETPELHPGLISDKRPFRWKPSIHMPKRYARIWLEVVGVRVERVQEISEEDARAEGCDFDDDKPPEGFDEEDRPVARDEFKYLWNRINGKRPGCAWSDSPWVWMIEFKRIEL